MPDVSDSEIPYSRRDRRKDDRIFRRKWHAEGPPLIAKCIVAEDTDSSVFSHFDFAGRATGNAKELLCPPDRSFSFGLESFFIFYSENKKERWNAMDLIKENIGQLQDPSRNFRVSCIQKLHKGSLDFGTYAFPSFGSCDRGCSGRGFTEYHTVKENGEEDHKYVNPSEYKTLARKPNPPRTRKGRLIRQKAPKVSASEATQVGTEQMAQPPLWERKMHVIYEELVERLSNRRVNMDKSLKRRRDNRLKTKRRPLMKMDAASKLDEEDLLEESLDESVQPSTLAACENASELSPYDSAQCCSKPIDEYFVHRQKAKRKKKVRHQPEAYYLEWLSHGTADSAVDKEIADSESDPTYSILESPETLDSVILPPHVQTKLKGEMLEDMRHVDGLWPPTYSLEVQKIPSTLFENYLPNDFEGIALLQKRNGQAFGRCILNPKIQAKFVGKNASKNDQSFVSESGLIDCFAEVEQAPSFDLQPSYYSLPNPKDYLSSTKLDLLLSAPCGSVVCSICCAEDVYCTSLNCGHFFCDQCWVSHINASIHDGRIPIKCPGYNCSVRINAEQMLAFVPYAVCCRYANLLSSTILKGSRNFRCGSCNAINIIKGFGADFSLARCQCGYITCLKCLQRAHVPMRCSKVAVYRTYTDNPANGRGVFRITVKQCPFCKRYCQKNGGCNHMTCVCGKSFCYNCCGPWKGGHSKCIDNKQEMHLVDVPRAFHLLSRRALETCLQLRVLSYSAPMRKALNKSTLNLHQKRHLMSVCSQAFEMLELCAAYLYLLKRDLRLQKMQNQPFEGLSLQIGILKKTYDKLKCRALRMKVLYEVRDTKSSKPSSHELILACNEVEYAICSMIRVTQTYGI